MKSTPVTRENQSYEDFAERWTKGRCFPTKVLACGVLFTTAFLQLYADTLYQNPVVLSDGVNAFDAYVAPYVIDRLETDKSLPIVRRDHRDFFAFTPAGPGSAQTAVSDGLSLKLGLYIDIDRPGINASATLTKFRFDISAEEDAGWVLTQRNGVGVIASGQVDGDFPNLHTVEVPLSSRSQYGVFHGSDLASGLALHVYSSVGTPGMRIWVGFNLGVDGNLIISDVAGPNLSFQRTAPRTTKSAAITVTGVVSDFSGVRKVYFNAVRKGSRKIPARLRGNRWSARLPLVLGSNIFRVTAVDKKGRSTRKVIKITRR